MKQEFLPLRIWLIKVIDEFFSKSEINPVQEMELVMDSSCFLMAKCLWKLSHPILDINRALNEVPGRVKEIMQELTEKDGNVKFDGLLGEYNKFRFNQRHSDHITNLAKEYFESCGMDKNEMRSALIFLANRWLQEEHEWSSTWSCSCGQSNDESYETCAACGGSK